MSLEDILRTSDSAEEALYRLRNTDGVSIMKGVRPTAMFTSGRRCIEYMGSDGTYHIEEIVLSAAVRSVHSDHEYAHDGCVPPVETIGL